MGTEPEEGAAGPHTAVGISAGDRLGRFEILGPLGAGGMGAVYRARDPKLHREVAIKVLRTAFRHDPDRQRGFEREARAAAALGHPNIIAIHDFGVHDEIGFIVTELLEGQTLREKITDGLLPPRAAVDYAMQIASGLAAGHDRGIVHRDIKPENLFITTDGRLKILDFGVAKTAEPDSSNEATETLPGEAGRMEPVVGTVTYMSPEQARGKRTDHRSDIFSLGVVLYEMLAGFAPFRRASAGETIHAILHDDPPDLVGVAPELDRIVRRCLDKSPEGRFQSARDLAFDLQALPASALSSRRPIAKATATRRRTWIAIVSLLVLAGVTLGYFGARWWAPAEVAPDMSRVERITEFEGLEEFPAISPDGKSIAFTALVDGRRQLFVRLLAGGRPVQITSDPVDHQAPRWTPGSESLVYFSSAEPGEGGGAIWSIPALGGSPRRIIDCISDADVDRNGRLACFRMSGGKVELATASLDGTDVRGVAASVPGYHRYPRWSPDGQWIAFQRGDGVRNDIFVVPSGGGEVRKLTQDRNAVRGLDWLPDSRGIVYASSRESTLPYLPPLGLWQVGLDGKAPRRVSAPDVWYEQPDIDSAGVLSASRLEMRFDVFQFSFSGDAAENVRQAIQLTRQTGQVLTPTAAPDGKHIAFLSNSGGHGNLWLQSTGDGQLRQLTFEEDPNVALGVPVWSPDGKAIAFVSSKGRTGYDFGIWLVDPDGRNPRKVAEKGLGFAWSPDGEWIYYAETSAGVLDKVRATGGPAVTVRREATRNVIGLHGDTLYYTVERVLLDGRPEVEIRAATPESGPSRQVARLPASRIPSWQIVNPSLSPDGEWLALPLTDGLVTNIWAVSTRNGTFRQVTDFGDRATFIARRVSWSADGKSILAAVGEGDADIVRFDGWSARRQD
jgi:Tol biopolymer transport system component/tRNA A-37 threonylcarbamoyl transferase component Bud32